MDEFKPPVGRTFSLKKTAAAFFDKIFYHTSIELFIAGIINGFLLMMLLFLVDHRVGPYTLTLLYLIPVSIITLTAGRMHGVIASFAAALLELLASQQNLPVYKLALHSLPLPLIWNTLNSLIFFLIFALLLSKLKQSMISERFLSRLDPLTGLYNGRHFTELVTWEIERGKRYQHPLAIVYINCENLNHVARALGQPIGDEIIKTTASRLRRTLRATDGVAYFGGSEFGAALPETNAFQAAATVQRIKNQLLDCAVENLWPVNYRIGVETFSEFTEPPEKMVKQAYLQMRRDSSGGETATTARPA